LFNIGGTIIVRKKNYESVILLQNVSSIVGKYIYP
jgi:hypothetical protein